MKVVVLNGSPKGKYSITLQTVLYIQKHYPNDVFKVLNVGQQYRTLEKDFIQAKNDILEADLILFSYPVYTFIAPAQLHVFIELMKKNFSEGELKGKFASQITTSKHFYDTTAQKYIEENCKDLQLNYFTGLYADMDDLTKKRGQQEALDFWRYIHFQIDYAKKTNVEAHKDRSAFKVQIVANLESDDVELKSKIDTFRNNFPYETSVFNVADFKFDGGCISCFKCASKGNCIYKDGFSDYLRNDYVKSDAVIYAFTIKDHSMGAKFKFFDDRQFCNGHRTLSMDKPIGYIVNGDLSSEKNLQEIIYGRASVGHNVLVHIANDKKDDEKILSDKLSYLLENPVVQPQNFYGVGGMKIFRDLIYIMGGMMKADYQFYKKTGFFNDMPHKQNKTRRMMKLVGMVMSNEKLMKKAGSKVNEGMLMPYTKVLNEKE